MLIRWLRRCASLPELPNSSDNKALALADYTAAGEAPDLLGRAAAINGLRMLDVGCGLGGKTLRYAERGAHMVVGFDISLPRARVARSLADSQAGRALAEIVVGDAAALPFWPGVFDRVVSSDTWEHLRAPAAALQECALVVRPGGEIHISAVPWYSPWGAHAWYWLPLPWVQLWLSRRALFRLVGLIERCRKINARLPDAVRLDWSAPNDPAHAQQLTVASLERAVEQAGLRTISFTIVPVGARHGGVFALVGHVLARLPLLREWLAGMVVIVARKEGDVR